MGQLVFFLEEDCAKALLDALLPRMLPPGADYRCIVFEGKRDLEEQLVRRLRGYRIPGARFIILRDKDAGDCHAVKNSLTQKCAEAGRPEAVVRIACHELESWYLADLAAVETGLGIPGLRSFQNKAKYRAPDNLAKPSKELLSLAPGYQKISGSRSIGPHLDIANKRSRSYGHFITAVSRLAAIAQQGH